MRDGRRQRLGLQTGTEGTVQDTYLDRILSDVDVAGEPNILSLDPDANVRTTDQRYLSDAYNYYLGGGYDASQPDFPIQAEDIIDGGGGSGAGDASSIGTIPLDQTGVTGVNTPFEQNLLDQGVGVQGAPGDPVVAPGEMPVTQAEMDAFNQIPVNREYGDPMDIGYGEGQVDPNLAAAVGGKDTTLIAPTITGPTGDIYAPGDYTDVAGTLGDPAEKMDFVTEQDTSESIYQKAKNYLGEKVAGSIDWTSVIAKGLINKFVGGPVTLLFDAAKALAGMLPQNTESWKINNQLAVGGKLSSDILSEMNPDQAKRISNYNMQSGSNIAQDPFGLFTGAHDYVEGLVEAANYNGTNQFRLDHKEFAQRALDKRAAESGGVEFEDKTVLGPGEFLPEGEELVTAEQLAEEKLIKEIDAGIEAADEEPVGIDAGTADIQDFADIYEPPTQVAAPISIPVPQHIKQPDPPSSSRSAPQRDYSTHSAYGLKRGGRVKYGNGGIVDLLK